jgi:parvulin-like peptidyl-prolyl isomerase
MIERRGEKIHTKHILVRLVPSVEDEQRTINELKAIRQKILDGADFGAMADKYSDDENVVKDHGHLGIFEVENMVIPQFKKVVQTMKIGDISEPFKTDFGYHIVKLNDRQAARKYSLEKDWDRIQQIALNHKMQIEYEKWIKEIKKTVPIEIREPL